MTDESVLVEFFRTERPDEGWRGDERGESPEQCAIRVMRAQARQLKSYGEAPLAQNGTAVALLAEYRRCCEEWGASLDYAWLDRITAIEERLLELLALAPPNAPRPLTDHD